MTGAAIVQRLVVRNYRSIAACEADLAPVTFLAGPDGAGASNVLDALRFTADAVRHSLDRALRDRGGVQEVRRRSGGHPNHFGVRLDFGLPDGAAGHYAFLVGSRSPGGYEVQAEECSVSGPAPACYRVESGETALAGPPPAKDRLYLASVAARPEFRPVWKLIEEMVFLDPDPRLIRDWQPPDSGEVPAPDGGNLAAVLRRMAEWDPDGKRELERRLTAVLPGLEAVEARAVGSRETLEFVQAAAAGESWRFPAAGMPGGVLRAVAVLAGVYGRWVRPPLAGVEEPEAGLDPGAAAALLAALRAAGSQMIVTTHSPDLLDHAVAGTDAVIAVRADAAGSVVARVDGGDLALLRRGLREPGELVRLPRPRPEPALFGPRQMRIFQGAE